MNPEIKAKWVAALRSGEYPQCKLYLKNENGFCCLGVLCEIGVKEGIIPAPFPKDSESGAFIYEDPKSGAFIYTMALPPSIFDWAELRNGYVTADLTFFNDIENLSFDEIANWIEENL